MLHYQLSLLLSAPALMPNLTACRINNAAIDLGRRFDSNKKQWSEEAEYKNTHVSDCWKHFSLLDIFLNLQFVLGVFLIHGTSEKTESTQKKNTRRQKYRQYIIGISTSDRTAEIQLILIHVTSTNTHRKCDKALSGEIIFSSLVLALMLLCGRFLEFAAEELPLHNLCKI